MAKKSAAAAVKEKPAPVAAVNDVDQELNALLEDATTVAVDQAESIDLEEIEAQAESIHARTQAYENQAGEPEGDGTPAAASNDDSAPTQSRGKRAAAGSTPSEQLKARFEAPELLEVAMLTTADAATEETVDALFTKVNGLAKKVGEKAVNMLKNKGNLGKLQVYTKLALELLKAKGGKITSGDLFAHFSTKYKEGTARSQAAQIMQLLPAMEICQRNKTELTLRDDSILATSFGIA